MSSLRVDKRGAEAAEFRRQRLEMRERPAPDERVQRADQEHAALLQFVIQRCKCPPAASQKRHEK